MAPSSGMRMITVVITGGSPQRRRRSVTSAIIPTTMTAYCAPAMIADDQDAEQDKERVVLDPAALQPLQQPARPRSASVPRRPRARR